MEGGGWANHRSMESQMDKKAPVFKPSCQGILSQPKLKVAEFIDQDSTVRNQDKVLSTFDASDAELSCRSHLVGGVWRIWRFGPWIC